MDSDYLKLLGLHRAEFELAKQDQSTSRKLYGGVFLFGTLSLIVSQFVVIYIFAISAFVLTVLGSFFAWYSRRRHEKAERGRRVVLLMKGLGWRISQKEKTDLLESFSANKSKTEHWEDDDYFTTTGNSFGDLAQLIQESAFWSRYLYWESAKNTLLFSLFWIVLLLAPLFFLPFFDQSWSFGIARAVSLGLMFLITIESLWRGVAYFDASRQSENIDGRLEHIISLGATESDVVAIFGDYNAVVEGAPLISTKIYKRNRDRLNELWNKRLES